LAASKKPPASRKERSLSVDEPAVTRDAPVGEAPVLRVLLAEDNKINQQFVRALLRKAGHAVDTVENGRQAVDAVRRGAYDVVLMDVQMPELDGVQATRQIRALDSAKSGIPIIAVTAHAMTGAREQYLAAGMDDYVTKPVKPDVLLSKLADIALAVKPRGGSAAAMDATAELDIARLDGIATMLEPTDLVELVGMYFAETEERLSRIRERSTGGDLAALAREAHTLIGVAGNLGAMRVENLAREVERACKAGEATEAVRLAAELVRADGAANTALRAWLAARGAPARHPELARAGARPGHHHG
jgi:CheY-like chemotaxis protein/HPt (histidine-containing phosphotransfer) domain-containing protein